MLTLNHFKVANLADVVRAAMAANEARGVQEIGAQHPQAASRGVRDAADGAALRPSPPARSRSWSAARPSTRKLCFACHGDDGRGAVAAGAPAGTTMAPSLASSSRVQGHRDYVIKTLLHGMDGPIDGRSYAGGVMAPMGTNRDEWIADIGSYVRNSFGNVGPFISQADVARVRAATAGRTAFWKVDELVASLPAALEPAPAWKVTASHNAEAASAATSFAGWSTGTAQQPGMWFQIELPDAAAISEIQFVSPGGGRGGGGRGRGGRGGRGAAGAGAPGGTAAPAGVPPADSAVPIAPPAAPAPGSVGNHPRAYKVDVSTDGSTWITVSEGQGAPGSTTIAFAPVTARFVRITQTGAVENAPPWSMQRLRLFAAGK